MHKSPTVRAAHVGDALGVVNNGLAAWAPYSTAPISAYAPVTIYDTGDAHISSVTVQNNTDRSIILSSVSAEVITPIDNPVLPVATTDPIGQDYGVIIGPGESATVDFSVTTDTTTQIFTSFTITGKWDAGQEWGLLPFIIDLIFTP